MKWIIPLSLLCTTFLEAAIEFSEPVPISSNFVEETAAALKGNSHVRLAGSLSGNVIIAVWDNANLDSNGVKSIQSAVMLNGRWSNTVQLGSGITPQIAVTNDGSSALAVWSNLPLIGSTTSTIYYARYTVADGWSTALPIAQGSNANLLYPQIAMDKNGNAIAVWVGNVTKNTHGQSSATSDTHSQIFASDFNVTANPPSWSDPVILSMEENTFISGTLPALFMDQAGKATVSWQTVRDNSHTEIVTVQVTRRPS